MLKYLVILLDDSSVAYCHYKNRGERHLISAESLRSAILFAMKENLSIQFVWPDYELPQSHKDIINSIDHVNITPLSLNTDADIIVTDKDSYDKCPDNATVVALLTLSDFMSDHSILEPLTKKAKRVNIVFTDPSSFKDKDTDSYAEALSGLSDLVLAEYRKGHPVEVNILTDRIMLDRMNNCNAGHESLCVAPDGKFYVCPAFYYGGEVPVGDPITGAAIPNECLYRLDHTPICRQCDAYHCRRCVWHNKANTLEVNTPGHEQCVMSHLEREASRKLLESIRQLGDFMPEVNIEKLDYNDPFDKVYVKHLY